MKKPEALVDPSQRRPRPRHWIILALSILPYASILAHSSFVHMKKPSGEEGLIFAGLALAAPAVDLFFFPVALYMLCKKRYLSTTERVLLIVVSLVSVVPAIWFLGALVSSSIGR